MALRGVRMTETSVSAAAVEAPGGVPAGASAKYGPLSSSARLATAAAGALALVLVTAHFGIGERALVAALLVSALAVLSAIDIERRLLPNRIVLPAFGMVLLAQLALFPDQALEWVVAALGTGLVLLTAALLKPGGLGYGDVKLGLLLGAGLGEEVVTALVVGILAIWPVAAYLYLRTGRAAAKVALPLCPFLSFGAVVALLAS